MLTITAEKMGGTKPGVFRSLENIQLMRVLREDNSRSASAEGSDGRQVFHKIFVETKMITALEFDLCWPGLEMNGASAKLAEPFLQQLADRGILPLSESLKVVAEKSRIPYLPINQYELDVDLARSFPAETCLRWCVLPFDCLGASVMVATANPFNRQAAGELARAGGKRLFMYLASPPELMGLIRKIYLSSSSL
jgi:hypothetical protein